MITVVSHAIVFQFDGLLISIVLLSHGEQSWHHQVKYLYGDVQKAGGDAARFYADDVIYEDMNYETPFIGQSAVEGFLKRVLADLVSTAMEERQTSWIMKNTKIAAPAYFFLMVFPTIAIPVIQPARQRGFQNIQGVTFNLEEVSDGDQAVGFTYTIEIAGQPRGIRGITYYQVWPCSKDLQCGFWPVGFCDHRT